MVLAQLRIAVGSAGCAWFGPLLALALVGCEAGASQPGADTATVLRFDTQEAGLALREALLEQVFGEARLPDAEPDEQTTDEAPSLWEDLPGLHEFEELVFYSGELGLPSYVAHFRPEAPHGGLVVYHQGHRGHYSHGRDTIAFFLEAGYAVMAMAMPLRSLNAVDEVTLPDGTVVPLVYHGDFEVLEALGYEPMRYFFEPVARVVEYGLEEVGYDDVTLVGISGGGWTVTWYAALDPRVSTSYPVSGTLPFDLRVGDDVGDYEQLAARPIYASVNYLDLYGLAALEPHRRHHQMFNQDDPCCFHTRGREDAIADYVADVQDDLAALGGGEFTHWIDTTHEEHLISEAARDEMLAHLEGE